MIFLDLETCGFHSVPVLLQYAEDAGPVCLWNFWSNTVGDTVDVIEDIVRQDVCAFNLAFDWFHLNKWYTILQGLPRHSEPIDLITQIARVEQAARFKDVCIKPRRALDLMLHARKGPFQSLMKRKPVRVRRVPAVLAPLLAQELTARIELDGIYFNNRDDRWKVLDGDDSEFKDVQLSFNPRAGLKSLARHVLKENVATFDEISPPEMPEEQGYKPFGSNWPDLIEAHVGHWQNNQEARQYAEKDVVYLQRLYEAFGRPEPGDNDSELAVCVACCRWRGYRVDAHKLEPQLERAKVLAASAPQHARAVREYLNEAMSSDEQQVIADTTAMVVLESIAGELDKDGNWGGGWLDAEGELHPAAARARKVILARKASKEQEIFEKLLSAKRFHASFKVIGTKSTRMSGDGSLNPQGIKSTKAVRGCFPLSDDGFVLCGGDFDAFEVALLAAAYPDPELDKVLDAGKKIHGVFGEKLFPGESYETILASKGTDNDLYTDAKRGFFLKGYGGDAGTMSRKIGIPAAVAEQADSAFNAQFAEMASGQADMVQKFTALKQQYEGGPITWTEPAEYVSSLLGFRRYFTLEWKICRALFELAESPPKYWHDCKVKVRRRKDKSQFATNAVRSALYGAAFALQGSVIRASINHVSQSTGGDITKHVQRAVWDHQPSGVHRWYVQPLNVHDELLCPVRQGCEHAVKATVDSVVESYRPKVKHIKMDWAIGLETWADK